ncbi:MAG TPA: hypothetical protein VIL09_00190 [Microvirga sp.]|jgi:hypothetical protein
MRAFAVCHIKRMPEEAGASTLAEGMNALGGIRPFRSRDVWIVRSDATSDQIRDALQSRLPPGEGIIVVSLGLDASWHGLDAAESEWLTENI